MIIWKFWFLRTSKYNALNYFIATKYLSKLYFKVNQRKLILTK